MPARILTQVPTCTLRAGDLEATFLSTRGMLGASLRHRGVELLQRVDDLDQAALAGRTAGIPFLHPWANRLAGFSYRAAGRRVVLDPKSPLLRFDVNGLPIHGVPWSLLMWQPLAQTLQSVTARLDWMREDLRAVFPFRHRIEIAVRLDPEGLNIETTLQATGDEPVPVSFGFHPYFALPDLPRRQWRLSLPRMHQLALDGRRIPSGATTRFEPFEAPLAEHDFDDGFELDAEGATLAISGNGLRIGVELLAGYRYVQVYAPKGRSLISLEPMTAPTNALASGSGIAVVEPGKSYRAEFRVGIGADAR